MMERDTEGRLILQRIPLEGLRKMVAERMTESIRDFPQGTAFVKVDMSNLIAFREKLKEKELKVSFGDLFVKATACALEKNMELNAQRTEDEIVYFASINIGMMASVNGALIEPVIADVQTKTIEQVSAELSKTYENLKKGKLMRVKLEGATFSISNLGMYDVEGFTPLLSPPTGGILGIGSTRKEAVVDSDASIVVRPMATLSITTDHGLVDGVSVMKFLQALKDVCQKPEEYMYAAREMEVPTNV